MSDIVGLAESCFKNSQEPPKGRRDKKKKKNAVALSRPTVLLSLYSPLYDLARVG